MINLKVIYEINNNLELLQSLGYSKMQISFNHVNIYAVDLNTSIKKYPTIRAGYSI